MKSNWDEKEEGMGEDLEKRGGTEGGVKWGWKNAGR